MKRKPYAPEALDEASIVARVAYRLLELGHQQEHEDLIAASRRICENTLMGDFPSKGLMASAAAFLESQGVSYALIGGVALSVRGLVRSTSDIDILVDALPNASRDIAAEHGFYPSKSHTGTVMTIDHKSGGMIELLLANDPLRRYALHTAERAMVLGSSVLVVTSEALVGLKAAAAANNPSRARADMADSVAVVVHNPDADYASVRQLLDAKTTAIFDRAVRNAV